MRAPGASGAAGATRRGFAAAATARVAAAVVALTVLLAPGGAAAQMAPGAVATPLDHRVVINVRGVSLREALDRIAAAARVRISYASDLLPLDRAVRQAPDTSTVREMLGAVLSGVPVHPVVAGADLIVLAPELPVHGANATGAAGPDRLTTTSLDRVVVTGSAAGRAERALAIGLTVIEGTDLVAQGVHDLASALNTAAPGLWAWPQSPVSLVARYGSIRGASSFGASYPKVYVDGIVVANPLLLNEFDPESIQRIEVIRGPQGAALYGADAISGVVNIVTRNDVGRDAQKVRTHSSAGVSATSYAADDVIAQDHRIAAAFGTPLRASQVNAGVSTLGAFYPGASSRTIDLGGATRVIGSQTVFTGTARYYDAWVDAATNPLLAQWATAPAQPQSLRQYTLGGSVKRSTGGRWTHAAVAGVDGYSLSNVANEFTPFPSSTDSALRAARGAAARTTLRISSVARLGDDDARDGIAGTLTLAAEHSALRQETPSVALGRLRGPGNGPPMGPVLGRRGSLFAAGDGGRMQSGAAAPSAEWLNDAGILAQLDLSLGDAWYVSGGARLERNDGYLTSAHVSTLPSLGVAWVRDAGIATLKLRAAYGRGIRAPRSAARETLLGGLRAATSLDLAPEEQSGVEGGIDLFIGRAFSLRVTRFDQLASGLIQQVVVPDATSYAQAGGPAQRLALEYQNVGSITNRGWEAQATLRHGRLSLAGAYATVDSRVRTTAAGYGGDLRPGDRMLDVPERTVSATATWTGSPWTVSLGVSRAFDWIDYDRLSVATAYATFDGSAAPLYGSDLRGYWRLYGGNTFVNANLAFRLNRGVYLTLGGENLLNRQRGEPDNVTILPGRTIATGLRLSFP